jgi:tetratricopeptide (TPR) repeat protein
MPKSPTSAQLTGIGIPLPWLRQHLDGAKLSLVILDACRSLANVSAKGPTEGLAPFFARGSLIAYAADEGQTANDNDSEDVSLFTKHLIVELSKADETLCQLFGGVRSAVDQASSHVQFPFVYDGVIGEFVFNRATTSESKKLSAISNSSGWNQAWVSIKDSDDPNDFAALVGTGPQHASYTRVASERLSTLMSFTAKAVGIVPLKAQEAPELIAIANQAERLFYERAYKKALETYQKLVSHEPTEVEVLYDYATCLLHLGRNDEAIHFFTEALKLDPDFPWAYHNRGVAHHLKGSLKAAIDDYDEALKRRPSNALIYNNLALAKRQFGDLPGADSDAKESLSLDPHYAPAYYNRVTILLSTGDAEAAAHYKNEGKILTVPTKDSPPDRMTAKRGALPK